MKSANLAGLRKVVARSKRRYGLSAVALSALCALTTGGCVSDWFHGDKGVPLAEFTAKDGKYFPDFIAKFFRGAKRYQKQFPTTTLAASDVRLIEIKELNRKAGKNNEANLSWSADGVYLGFEVVQGAYRKIMLKDLVGDYTRELKMIPKSNQNFLDGMVVKSAHSYNAGLKWSRDSNRFAFMSNGGIGEYNIYVGAVGAKEKTVAKSPTKDGYATWSPSTNEIAFVSGRSGSGDIYLVELDSNKIKQLSFSNEVDIFPDWFPEARKIVYCSGDALNHRLMIVERDQKRGKWKKPLVLTNWDRDDLRPTVSPDGRYIAFYSTQSQNQNSGFARRWNIHVVPYVAGKTYGPAELAGTMVAKDVVIDLNTGPAWSPDSRKLFYVKRDPGVFNPIYAYDLFSGRRFKFETKTRMNRDILMSRLGVLSFRAQVGVWDRVYVALTNQGLQLQESAGKLNKKIVSKIHYIR